jgi:Xaa-Pro aminopeptidase
VAVPALPPHDHRGRLQRAQAEVPALGVDALLVTRAEHRRYLVGFTGTSGWLLLTERAALLLTDGRYDAQAQAQLADAGLDGSVELVITTTPGRVLAQVASTLRRVGLEAASVTWAAQRTYDRDWFPDAELVPTEGVVEAWRGVKEPSELARIEAAAQAADEALHAVIGRLGQRPTEIDFANELEAAMRDAGASGPSFETIVASGPNGALPHARPTDRVVREGDLVVIDFGATVDAYRSDMTRTVCVGEPTPDQRRHYDVVVAAQQAGVEAVAAGVEAVEVDAACRRVIAEAGWAEQFTHGSGHGLGLDIHEAPYIGQSSAVRLAEGSVVTVEPGVYLVGRGGVRIEDSVLVGTDGCRRLTRFPKRLEL